MLDRHWIAGIAIAMASALTFAPETMADTIEVPSSSTVSGGSIHAPPQTWRYTVGLGAGVAPDYEGSDQYDPVPVPLLRAQKGHRFGELFGLHVTSNLLDNPNWRIGPSLNYRKGYTDVGNNRVDDLKNRGGSVEVGVKGGYVFGFNESSLDLSLEFLHDVSGGHDGWVLTPKATYAMPLADRWNLTTGVEASYASGSYMSHYFSINNAQAASSGLSSYDADADFKDASLNMAIGYEWSENWGLHILAQYKRMLGDAKDSPVVDDVGDENQFFGGLVISYSWGG